ncbi:hypothetical protein AB3R30_21695 [Leptolyngbyaceae cyanobacterium UHCC 1019]
MNDQTVLLAAILKLVNGNKERSFELIKAIREQYPAKSMEWCLQKVMYDLRHGKKMSPPAALVNLIVTPSTKPTLQHWGVTGAVLRGTEEKPLAMSSRDLKALAETKRKMPSQSASESTKRKLYKLLLGDVEQGRRLVEKVRIMNPDRTEQWAVEKAIYDLERDRLRG